MNIYESAENYLETIYVLSQRNDYVRSVDVASELGFSKPSVSRAMKLLREDGCVLFEDSGHISLTEKGERRAVAVYTRHTVLTDFLVSLGVDSKTASDDACRIEHVISEATFEAIEKKMNV